MTHGLSKRERICSVTEVETLMSGGKYVAGAPLRCCWLKRDDGCTLNRMMVSVPKKLFKRAVKRNLLKRRIREAYRLQKELLPQDGIDMMYIYSSKELEDFASIYGAVGSILRTIDERRGR